MNLNCKNMLTVVLCGSLSLACSTKEKDTPIQAYYRMDYQKEQKAKESLGKYYSEYKNKLTGRGITRISCAVLLDGNKNVIPQGKHHCGIYGKHKIEITGDVPFKLWGGVEIDSEPFSVSCSYNQSLNEDRDYREEFKKELDWTLQYFDKVTKQ